MINRMRKASLVVVTTFLMASLLVCSIPTIAVAAETAGDQGKILIDYSHGAYKESAEHVDLALASNLTQMGFEVVFIWGGLNTTILETADGLILPRPWGPTNEYLASEVTAVGEWFNGGNKFLWVGGESDFVEADGGQKVLDNQTMILEEVGSHIYLEPTAVQDDENFAGASYRPVANITTDVPELAGFVEGVEEVFVHSPTCLYGSDSTTPAEGESPVALETATITNVYPLLMHSPFATIVDSDVTEPYAHTDGQTGAFVSVALELEAGTAGTSALVVSGGNIIGSYWPMMEDEYADKSDMDGMRFVKNTIMYGMLHAMTEQVDYKIAFDYSHGAYKAAAYGVDQRLYTSLFMMGYEVTELWGGLNSTSLAGFDGLVLPRPWGPTNEYLASEVTAVGTWFNSGQKFIWVGGESDFVEADGGQKVLDNQTMILEEIGSHVYLEPTAVQDSVSFAGASYRPVSTITGTDPYIADVVVGVGAVFTHSPTCLYGSDSATPAEGETPVALETASITNVYVLLQHSADATIVDSDVIEPYAHTDGQTGAFVSMTMEVKAGTAGSSVIVVSGGNIIGSYWPMMEDRYADQEGMDGLKLVRQAIHFGMMEANAVVGIDPMLLTIVIVGAVAVIIIIVIVVKRK
ncbi:MAG: hypothetical protein ACFFEV_03650 [Candidatus Thorarchaeota archaeon]